MSKFEVGDIVKVVNTGHGYSRSNLYAKKLKLTKFIDSVIDNCDLKTFIAKWNLDIFKIVSIYHNKGQVFCGIEYPNKYPSNRQYIIDENGLERIKSKFQQLEFNF